MSGKHDQTNGEERKKTSGELDAAQKASGREKAESGEEEKADGESEAGAEGSEGARPRASSRRVAVKRSSGKKAKDGLTSVAEEEKTGGSETGEVERDAAGRVVPGQTEPEADEAKESEVGNDTKNKGGGPATMTEAAQRQLVNRLLGRANEMAGSKDFKLSAADLIRLIQFQKEMTAKPRKVTVQWVEDEKE